MHVRTVLGGLAVKLAGSSCLDSLDPAQVLVGKIVRQIAEQLVVEWLFVAEALVLAAVAAVLDHQVA
jgi:hypothetical protein